MKSEMGMSANLVYCHWISEIEFNKKLFLLIIRLANYSIITSLIYISKRDIRCSEFQCIASIAPSRGLSSKILTGVR